MLQKESDVGGLWSGLWCGQRDRQRRAADPQGDPKGSHDRGRNSVKRFNLGPHGLG